MQFVTIDKAYNGASGARKMCAMRSKTGRAERYLPTLRHDLSNRAPRAPKAAKLLTNVGTVVRLTHIIILYVELDLCARSLPLI